MRVTVLFFLFLCFSFLGSTDYLYSSPNHSGIYNPSTSSFNKTTHSVLLKIATTQIDKNTGLGSDENNFVITEDEEDHVFDRRIVFVTQYFATLSPSLGLISSIKYFKIALPFCSHLSNSSFKYILQRVLRI